MKLPLPHCMAVAFCALFVALISMPVRTNAQDIEDMSQKLQDLESRVEQLDREVKGAEGLSFVVLFLFGVVLAMWAQRHGKSGCLWFVLGFIPCINFMAALVALSQTPRSEDYEP